MRLARLGSLLLLMAIAGVRALALPLCPPATAGGPADLRAYLRVVNLAPVCTSVDVYLDHYRFVSSLPFGQATGYRTVIGKYYELNLRPSGVIPALPTVIRWPLDLEPLAYYTAIILGTPPDCSRVLVLYDDPSQISCGEVRVRFVNALLGAPPLTFTNNGAPIFTNVPYATASCYQTLPACNQSFTITGGGCIPFGQTTVRPGCAEVYTVIITGQLGPGCPPPQTLVLVER